MDYAYYDQHINKKTLGRYDITPIFRNPEVFSNLIKDLVNPFLGKKINKIAGLDALGFIIGGAVANHLNLGFVPIRKSGKLPSVKEDILTTSAVDYSGKQIALEMCKESVVKGDKVLIIDDWIETGSQMKAAINLIEKQGGQIAGISALFAEKNKQTLDLFNKYDLKAIQVVED